MSFRNRPVLDRKHRPRWQDELRTQQLVVAGFALAIAVAVGIFGAAAWSSFHESNLRQAAFIDGTAVPRAELLKRIQIVAAELQAASLDIEAHGGGVRDQTIQQQLQAIEAALNNVQQTGTDSLVTGLVLDHRAAELGGQPTDAEVSTAVESRRTHPERFQLSLIIRLPIKDEGADKLTDKDWEEARAEIDDVKAELDGGADFGELAAQHSADQSATLNGLLGWVDADDPQYGKYAEAAGDAEVGDVLGPLKSDAGWYLLRVEDRQAAGRDEILDELLTSVGVSDDDYREYVRQDLLGDRAQDYFASNILQRYQPQRKVAEIKINVDTGFPLPMQRIRHILVQPLPGADDQSTATPKQWSAALREALEVRAKAEKRKDTDWFDLAAGTADTESAARGGFLGWYDPTTLSERFVPEFADAVKGLEVGEISQPVRSQFGYHIIQVTHERTSAEALAQTLATELRDDPDSFSQVAKMLSEDAASAKKGGEVGWIIHYQYEQARDKAIFDLVEPGDISDPVTSTSGIYLYKLLDTADSRFVSQERRDALGSAGFNRWLDELKDNAGVWLDAEFVPAATTG
jgi:parvulin-like peptidyl-prolyl isomerase